MADNTDKTATQKAATKDTRSELQKRVEAKIASRSFNAKFLDGKNSLFDLSNYGADYRAGGALSGRFFMKNDARMSMARAQGFMTPEEWDPDLKNVSFGGMTLMLQESAHSKHRREQIEKLARAQEEAAHETEEVKKPWRDGGAAGAITLESKEQKAETFHNKPQRTPVGPD